MSWAKELYMAEHDRLIAEAVENGMDEATAYDSLADAAYGAMQDRIADMADATFERAKDAEFGNIGADGVQS